MLDPLTMLLPAGPLAGPIVPPVAPVASPRGAARRAALDLRIEGVLRAAARGFGYDAAELWLLDDATSRLRLRGAAGAKPPQRVTRRALAEADADVAAMAGAAVVLTTVDETRLWRLHRAAGSAVCLPVASDLTIHGAVWLFSRREQEPHDAQLELMEVVATRLAVELEREELLGRLP